MEHTPNKLMATPSCQGQGVHAEIDRLSDLPDAIAHHIFSFLDQKDISRVGCVSKRCQQFHLSTPSLEIDFRSFPYARQSSCAQRLQWMNSLDRLISRRGDNIIQAFHVHWAPHKGHIPNCFCDESFRIMMWVHDAVRCKVEELNLHIHLHKETPLALSSFMFLCKTLRSLSLNMKCVLKAPPMDSSSNLTYLNLRDVCIIDELFFTWISMCCKCIKELHLQDISGARNITIESSSLQTFIFKSQGLVAGCNLKVLGEKLECLVICWGRLFIDRISSLNLFAPNLKYLGWSRKFFSHQNLGELSCLKKASLSMKPTHPKEFKTMHEIFGTIRGVKILVLNRELTEGVLRKGLMPAKFGSDVYHMQMHIGCLSDIMVPELVSLFRRMSKLNTLHLKSDQSTYQPEIMSSGFDMAYWKSQNLDGFVKKLKVVTIELLNGLNGIELARYILDEAKNLKKMMIVHSPQQSEAVRMLSESKSSNATLVIEEDPKRGTRRHGARELRLFYQMLERPLLPALFDL